MITTISAQKALEARGLFALAQKHYRIVREAERALAEIFDTGDDCYADQVSDEIYNDNGSFDVALKNAGVTVMPAPKQKKRR